MLYTVQVASLENEKTCSVKMHKLPSNFLKDRELPRKDQQPGSMKTEIHALPAGATGLRKHRSWTPSLSEQWKGLSQNMGQQHQPGQFSNTLLSLPLVL